MLLLGVQVQAAGRHARLVGAVEREHERGDYEAEREHDRDRCQHPPLARPRLGVQRLARTARPSAHREEEDGEAEDDPEDNESVNHRAAQYRSANLKGVSSVLRRLSFSRLLLLCGVIVAVVIGATALALAVSTGPTPPPKPLAEAVHDALSTPKVDGVSARIQLTDNLLEGANLASGGGEASQLSKSPLLSGASGRLWIGPNGHARLELQSEKGDTQILWDGTTAEMYDASTNTLYRYTPAAHTESGTQTGSSSSGTATSGPSSGAGSSSDHEAPSVAKIEEAISHLKDRANVSGATPTDVAGQAAYTVRVSPKEGGSLIGGAELSWDAVHGVPLRAAVYSTSSSTPVIELAATEISYGPVASSALEFTPPANAKVQDVTLPSKSGSDTSGSSTSGSSTSGEKPKVTTHGKGLATIVLAESPVKTGAKAAGAGTFEGLPKVDVNGASASELQTALGTVLSFERSGVRYLVAGSVTPATIEAFARSL